MLGLGWCGSTEIMEICLDHLPEFAKQLQQGQFTDSPPALSNFRVTSASQSALGQSPTISCSVRGVPCPRSSSLGWLSLCQVCIVVSPSCPLFLPPLFIPHASFLLTAIWASASRPTWHCCWHTWMLGLGWCGSMEIMEICLISMVQESRRWDVFWGLDPPRLGAQTLWCKVAVQLLKLVELPGCY